MEYVSFSFITGFKYLNGNKIDLVTASVCAVVKFANVFDDVNKTGPYE